ncbi:cytochrome c [Geobacter sp. FeAm09]|uniref:c-type cytochrome n=1 Tax=Geobacter sp. FeAm09 TaxID=2597769 RepID=UPI0011EF0FD5|nr:c-type cytochrome [Geobacter sp. FeAm09]QEM68528.1 cytochrome c [Geobacter sp. FeAm09]
MRRTHALILLAALFALTATTACTKNDANRPVEKSSEQTAAPAQKLTGEQLFKSKCAQCHKIKDQGGVVGPDLTAIASRKDAASLQDFIKDPKKQNPSTAMPSFADLPADDIKAIADYLGSLK